MVKSFSSNSHGPEKSNLGTFTGMRVHLFVSVHQCIFEQLWMDRPILMKVSETVEEVRSNLWVYSLTPQHPLTRTCWEPAILPGGQICNYWWCGVVACLLETVLWCQQDIFPDFRFLGWHNLMDLNFLIAWQSMTICRWKCVPKIC